MIKKLLCFIAAFAACAAFAAVDVNKADQAALESIKGVGPAVSGRMLEERKKGQFKDWSDLVKRVKGVGEGNASKFSANGLTVNGATFTPSPAKEGKKAATKPAAVNEPGAAVAKK